MSNLTKVPANLSDYYIKKWNVNQDDFFYLHYEGKRVSNTIYREGMWKLKPEGYSVILKGTEEEYESNITTDVNRKKHIQTTWCIVDSKGIEKVVCTPINSPYVYGIIYSYNRKYTNIETGRVYGIRVHNTIETELYLFLESYANEISTKKICICINKETGITVTYN